MEAYGEVDAYLRRRVPELLGGIVQRIEEIDSGVWCLCVDGKRRAVKYHIFAPLTRGKAYDVLEVERDVLCALGGAGCRVPAMVALDSEACFAFYEWVGDATLDDLVQERCGDHTALACDVMRNQRSIDGVLMCDERWAQRVAPGGSQQDLLVAWQLASERALWGGHALQRHLQCPPLSGAALDLIAALCSELARRPPVLGSSDYNARNIVISPVRAAFFLEFSKLSWDWTERRIVQYTTSMGSGRCNGVVRSVLNARAARFYAELTGDSGVVRALEGHQIAFLLNAAAALCEALEHPLESANAALLRAWQNPCERLQAIARALSEPLGDDEDICHMRAAFTSN